MAKDAIFKLFFSFKSGERDAISFSSKGRSETSSPSVGEIS